MNLKLFLVPFLITLGSIFSSVKTQPNNIQKNSISHEMQMNSSHETPEESVSLLTKIIDKVETWNEKYIIPLSYTYIFLDLGQKFVKGLSMYFTQSKSHITTLNPLNPGNDPFHQKVASTVMDVAKKVGTTPTSIIIQHENEEISKWGAYATTNTIAFERSLFEDAPLKVAEFTIGHELGHVKKRHVLIAQLVAMVSGYLFSEILEEDKRACVSKVIMAPLDIVKKKYNLKNNEYHIDDIERVLKLVFTSPLLYYLLGKIAWYSLSRYQEKQADMVAAFAVGAEGGIQDYKRFPRDHTTGLFDTHPCSQERVNYLQALQN